MNEMSPTKTLAGPIELESGLTAIDVWQSLHASERSWRAKAGERERMVFGHFVDGSDRQLLKQLRPFPAARWTSLCNGAGWTPVVCAALSWCDGADLDEVLDCWRHLGAMPEPGNAAERAASLLNPALLPDNRFTALAAVGRDLIGVAVLVAARSEAPEPDLPRQQRHRIKPAIAALIRTRSDGYERRGRS